MSQRVDESIVSSLGLNWRREALFASLAAMELTWVYAWLSFFFGELGEGQRRFSYIGLYVMLLIAITVGRILTQRRAAPARARQWIVLLTVLSTLLLVRVQLYSGYGLLSLSWLWKFVRAVFMEDAGTFGANTLVVAAGLYVWWWGLNLSQRGLTHDWVGFRFRLGVLILIVLLVVAAFAGPLDITGLIFFYFLVSLLAIALARVEEASESQVGLVSPFKASWLGILIGAAALVLLAGLLADRVWSIDVIKFVLQRLDPVLKPLDRLLYYVLLVIVRLLEPLMLLLIKLFRALAGSFVENTEGLQKFLQQTEGTFEEVEQAPPPAWFAYLKYVRWGLIALLVVLAVWIVARALQRRRRWGADATAVRESIWSREAFQQDLAGLLRRGLDRLRGLGDLAGRLRPQPYSAASIRKIYASLTRLGGAMGNPRQVGETPYEYIPGLNQVLPDSDPDIAAITEAYVRVHYGEYQATREEYERVRESWERVRRRREQD